MTGPKDLFNTITTIVETDNAESGYCARGVGNILEKLKLPFERGDARDYIDTLPDQGWTELKISPEDAPPGAIIVEKPVDREPQTKGDEFGHISMKVLDPYTGNSVYASDKIRNSYDGSSRTNEYVVFVHPDFMGAKNLKKLQDRITEREGGDDPHQPLWQQDGMSEADAAREFFDQDLGFFGQLFALIIVASEVSKELENKPDNAFDTSADASIVPMIEHKPLIDEPTL